MDQSVNLHDDIAGLRMDAEQIAMRNRRLNDRARNDGQDVGAR